MYLDMNKKLIRLTESDLHKIIKASVNNILRESEWYDHHDPDYMGGEEHISNEIERRKDGKREEAFKNYLDSKN